MEDGLGPAFDVELLATSLREAHREASSLVDFLADHLAQSLPERVTVTRGGFFLSSRRPVSELKARFEEAEYRLRRKGEGAYEFEKAYIVGGIAIRTHRLGLDDWMKQLLGALAAIADHQEQVAALLKKYR